jgi:hypothetical protein
MKIKFSSTNSLFMFTLLFSPLISTAQPPQNIRIGTASIENYSASPDSWARQQKNLPSAHYVAESFTSNIRSKMQIYYPGISVSEYRPYKDQEATKANIIRYGNFLDFFLFEGHGDRPLLMVWDGALYFDKSQNQAESPRLSFGGTTKWVILGACQTLRLGEPPNISEVTNMFKGVHSILGFESNYHHLRLQYCKWQYWFFGWQCGEMGELQLNPMIYETFAQNWIGDGCEIWLAWLNSVQYILHDVGGDDIVPAVISVFGNVYRNGHWEQWLGAYEKYATMLNKPTPMGNSITEADYQWVPWYLYRITKQIGTNPDY